MPRTELELNSPSERAAPEVKLLLWLSIAWLVLFALFHSFPAIDTGFSSLLCHADAADPLACDVFPARDHWLTVHFRRTFYWVPIIACGLLAFDIARQYARNGWHDRSRLRAEVLALAAYAAGPLLLVNGILKAFSGRPRPDDTTLFGGHLEFVAAGDLTGACVSNCSFVSGEAAAAGWLLCLLPLLRGRFRILIAALIIDVSVAAPLLRAAMGGHFLSDVVLGWLIGAASAPALTVLTNVLLRRKTATLDRLG
jgi:membrane-associated phospholipid phosphatase